MSIRLSGLNPLSFVGVEAPQPPLLLIETRSPLSTDSNFNVGTFWIVPKPEEVWILISVVAGVAVWVMLSPGSSTATTYVADVGSAVPAAGILNVFGGTNIVTTGAGNTLTVAASTNVALEYLADDGHIATALVGLLGYVGSNVISTTGSGNTLTVNLINGSNGQTLIGGGPVPLWKNITSLGGSIAVTNGPNSINIDTTGTGGATQYTTDAGIAVPTVGGSLTIAGGSNINTAAGGNTVITNLDNSVSILGSVTTGTTITAGTGMIVTAGGIDSTGTTRLRDLSAGVMQTNAGGVVSSNNGTNGQVLIGGGAAPAWANLTSTGGSIAITNGPNSINLEVSGFIPPGSRPAFLAYNPSNFVGTCASSLVYLNMGANPGVPWTVVFDQTSSVFPGDGSGTGMSFTCPVTGKYYVEFYMDINIQSGSNSDRAIIDIRQSNGVNYRSITQVLTATNSRTMGQSVIIDMVAGETLSYFVSVVGTNTYLGNVSDVVSWVSGYLIA